MPIDLTLEYATVAAGFATNTTVSKPTNTVDGDFLLAGVVVDVSTAPTITPPAGWTVLHSSTIATRTLFELYWKIASSEGASWTWTHSFAQRAAFCKRFTGVDSATPEDTTYSVAQTNYSTPVTNSAITTATDGAAVIQVVSISYDTTTFSSHSLTNRLAITGGICLDGDIQNTAGTTGSKTVSLSADEYATGMLIALRPTITGQNAYPSSDISAGSWTPSTGTDLYATIDETSVSDTDYDYVNSNSVMRVALSSLSTPSAGTQTLSYRIKGSAEKKAIARLIEGSTTVQTFTDDPIPETLTTKNQTVTNSISNYGNLRFEIEIADATSAPSPSVAFGTIGTGVNGSTSIAVGYPASIAAGDLLVIVATTGATNSETPGTPSGWISQGSYATTDGVFGIDTGPRRVTVFTKEAVGGESGTVSVATTNGNTGRCTMLRFTKTHPSYVWDIAATGGYYEAGTAVSVTGGSLGFAPGDVVVVSNAQRVDTVTQSSQSLTASGITFGTRTNRATVAVTTGNDIRHVIDTYAAITSGTATVAPTWSYTASASCSAAIHFLRLREVPPTEKGRLTWVKFNVPDGSGSGISLAATAASSIAATGAVAMALPITGAAVSVTTVAGSLAMSIPIQGVAAALAASAGQVLLSMALSGGALVQAVGSAEVSMALPLQGAAQVIAAASGSLPASGSDLSGSAIAVASGTSAVSISVSLGGSALAQALAGAGVTVQTALEAAAVAQSSGSGGVTQAIPVQGAAAVQASGTGDAKQATPLAGSAAASVTGSGAAHQNVPISGSGTATATGTGDLQAVGAGALAGLAVVQVGATGNIGMSLPIAGFVQAATTSTGALGLAVPVQGTATVTVIAGGNLQVTLGVVMSGAALAQAAANGQLVLTVPLSAVALAQASASGVLSGGADSFVPNRARTVMFLAGDRAAEPAASNRATAFAATNRLCVAPSAARVWR